MTDASSKSRFVYVTFIRTSPDRLWTALTSPEFTKQYWFGRAMTKHKTGTHGEWLAARLVSSPFSLPKTVRRFGDPTRHQNLTG